jgi:hypothetical protein
VKARSIYNKFLGKRRVLVSLRDGSCIYMSCHAMHRYFSNIYFRCIMQIVNLKLVARKRLQRCYCREKINQVQPLVYGLCSHVRQNSHAECKARIIEGRLGKPFFTRVLSKERAKMSIASSATKIHDRFIVFRCKTKIDQKRNFVAFVEQNVLRRNIIVPQPFGMNGFESGGQLDSNFDKRCALILPPPRLPNASGC